MIPGWKIKREAHRLLDQIASIPRKILEMSDRKRYDAERWEKISVTEGRGAPGDKFAIFLIYQPGPLPGSVLETCEYFCRHDYNIVLVSNGTLPDASRERLNACCRYILERPNFGYDFGGYRDGIHFLLGKAVSPSDLVILNDSIWFPMVAGSAVLPRIESLQSDIGGLLMSPRRIGKLRKVTRLLSRRKPPFEFLESYFIHLRRPIWESTAFRDYWQTYEQSSSKAVTVKKGELGFSQAMAAAGFSLDALLRRDLFIEDIRKRPESFLDKTLKYAAYSDAPFREAAKDLASGKGGAELCERKRAHVIAVALRRRVNSSFCWATEEIFATHFIKKHNGFLFQKSREKYIEAVDAGDIVVDAPAALEEIRQRVARDKK
ncbi:rhamnan synthesis F family protein [Rhodobacter maris]|uniref:Rhamnan synthesis protein F n=1 Tax=Rhodobacter maris TaxID=446682 RepID=A0A285TAT4_9RHOB|nr:rhamnan synthesis F family protein [Rhodobacter maris]SOC18352.1 rhamnan synthesis protein F [Rhodobacter maris]